MSCLAINYFMSKMNNIKLQKIKVAINMFVEALERNKHLKELIIILMYFINIYFLIVS